MQRRTFGVLLIYPIFTLIGCGKDGLGSPAAPTPSPSPTPQPPTAFIPQSTCWGVRIGQARTAGVAGNLLQIVSAANIPHQTIDENLAGSWKKRIVSFDGQRPSIGIIFLLLRRDSSAVEYFEGSVEEVQLNRGDEYAAFSFNGTAPNAQGNC